MIDSHIHILPGIDDGAGNLEIACEMAKVAVSDGISALICTPHDLNFAYENHRDSVLESVLELQTELTKRDIPIHLYPGAELHIGPNLVDKVLNGKALSLADKHKHVLVELPRQFIPFGAENILETLLFHGYTPIIAHPERNPALASKVDLLPEWLSWGCKTQLTAMSITGQFNKAIQSVCKTWCQQGYVHIVASDAHRSSGRAPQLSLAHQTLCKWVGKHSADILTHTNPQHIINAQALESIQATTPTQPVETKNNRKLFSFFR